MDAQFIAKVVEAMMKNDSAYKIERVEPDDNSAKYKEPKPYRCPECGEVHAPGDTEADHQRHAVKALARRIQRVEKCLELYKQMHASISTPIAERREEQLVEEIMLMDQINALMED